MSANDCQAIADALAGQQQTLTAFLAHNAAQHPDAIAIEYGRNPAAVRLSYSAVLNHASALADELTNAGVQQGTIVPILTGRKNPALILTQLAVLLAGAAFAPMDPSFPVAVTSHKIGKCSPRLIVVQDVAPDKVQELERAGALHGAAVFAVNDEIIAKHAAAAATHSRSLIDKARPDGLAYVMFTSGSTGQPKGVLQTHEQACAAMRAFIPQFRFHRASRVLSTISAAWDISNCDTFATLSSGGVLCLSDSADVLKSYGDDLDAYQITSTNVPPALVSTIKKDSTIARLEVLISGGDKAETQQFAKWARLGPLVFNGYGLTETGIGNLALNAATATLDTSMHIVPLGHPYGENTVFISHPDSLEPVPDGEEGEIILGGPQIASGYLHEDKLTAERFISAPDGRRLFRTGDLGRRLPPDGAIQLCGRADDVIKLVGYRVGPEEVQAPLHEELGEGSFCCASAVDTADGSHDAKLVLAFVPPRPPQEREEARTPADASELLFPDDEVERHREAWQARLRRKAEERIAYYARPHAYLLIRFVPLNNNHKEDRKKVGEAVRLAVGRGQSGVGWWGGGEGGVGWVAVACCRLECDQGIIEDMSTYLVDEHI